MNTLRNIDPLSLVTVAGVAVATHHMGLYFGLFIGFVICLMNSINTR